MAATAPEPKILVKFETKSARVKGLAFHPKRPWILASLHNGVIQLWDYRAQTMIDKFEEHEGPVRGIDFHNKQPLFASGGDDQKVRVWNYSSRRCLFVLHGHLDYLRTVQFHQEYPWLLSASDDQTIRIWNWQSRTCISVLTGHNHYVMSAQFHPREGVDLVLSASLDQTVRVWDVAALRKKTVSIAGGATFNSQNNDNELFGASDAPVRHQLEGHTRGVNWASFHKTSNLIVSAADDREVKLWRYSDAKAWEQSCMRGHTNNVSCVIFHPKRELIISNSEDKTMRVWDTNKQVSPMTFRRENDRYWILAAHPTLNLLAAGHDTGLMMFKLNRERPPYHSEKSNNLYYYNAGFVYEFNLKTRKERPILSTAGRVARPAVGTAGAVSGPRSIQYNDSNRAQHCLLLLNDTDNSYELYTFPKGDAPSRGDEQHTAQKGYGKAAVWVSRSRFAVLDNTRVIWLKSLQNELKRKLPLEGVNVVNMFSGGVGRLLLRTPEYIMLYDIQAMKEIGRLNTPSRHPVKYVVWSDDGKYVALFSKAAIHLCTSRLEELSCVHETTRVKSGAWDPAGVLIYSTHTHIKYVLPHGDGGVVRSLDVPVYITSVGASAVTYIDRENKIGLVAVDPTEYLFKVALAKRRSKDVMAIVQSKKLRGQSIVAYLQSKGFPEVALHFVDDDETRFSLALECGNIGIASECAKRLDKPAVWNRLGAEALRIGAHEAVEQAYQKTKNFDRLSFLYLITGSTDKLSKMLQIATLRQDTMARFHNALYLGNALERVKVLHEAGQNGLAYLTAVSHGLEEQAVELQQLLKPEQLASLPDVSSQSLLFPPPPIQRELNWPLLEFKESFFDLEEIPDLPDEERTNDFDDGEVAGGTDEWGADDAGGKTAPQASPTAVAAAGGGWGALGGDLDIDLADGGSAEAEAEEDTATTADGDLLVMPLSGKSAASKWANNSALAADLAAAGAFDSAMHALHRQIGVVNFEPLRAGMLTIYSSAHCQMPLLPGAAGLLLPLQRSVDRGGDAVDLPAHSAFKLSHCMETLKHGYKAVTDGVFPQAYTAFMEVLHSLPLVVLERRSQVAEVPELLSVCREYVNAMRLQQALKEAEGDAQRQCALSAYLSSLKLQPTHQILFLRVAIKSAYSIKNFQTAGLFCRRLLELSVTANNPTIAALVNTKQIKQVLAACEKSAKDEAPIDYDESKPYTLCSRSLTPIYRGQPAVTCPYCGSSFKAVYDEQLCDTCQLSKIGADTTGLKSFME